MPTTRVEYKLNQVLDLKYLNNQLIYLWKIEITRLKPWNVIDSSNFIIKKKYISTL